jgi:hypothetical protein
LREIVRSELEWIGHGSCLLGGLGVCVNRVLEKGPHATYCRATR